jgi:hypothetical protein
MGTAARSATAAARHTVWFRPGGGVAMTWSETRRRLDALREIEAELDRTGGELPWHDEYADIFGDRRILLLQLRYRWRLMVEAQGGVAALAERHPGLVAVLRRHSAELIEPARERLKWTEVAR